MSIRQRYSRHIEICMLNVTGGVRGRAKDLFDDFPRQFQDLGVLIKNAFL